MVHNITPWFICYAGLPELKIDPWKLNLEVNETAIFKAKATGVGKENFSYKWECKSKGESIDSQTDDTLKIQNIKENDKGWYACTVENEYGNTAKCSAQLIVRGKKVIINC